MGGQNRRTNYKAVDVGLVAKLRQNPVLIVKRMVWKIQLADVEYEKRYFFFFAIWTGSFKNLLDVIRVGVVYQKAYSSLFAFHSFNYKTNGAFCQKENSRLAKYRPFNLTFWTNRLKEFCCPAFRQGLPWFFPAPRPFFRRWTSRRRRCESQSRRFADMRFWNCFDI